MSIKFLVNPATDAILGAQLVERRGSMNNRTDVIADAMAGGITASGLIRLELAYAPQFGSAKDPINQLGHVADNLRTGAHPHTRSGTSSTPRWTPVAAPYRCANGRSTRPARIPGAINSPVNSCATGSRNCRRPIVVHCQVGQFGHTAARVLDQHGFDVVNLDGGYRTWRAGTAATKAAPPAGSCGERAAVDVVAEPQPRG